MNKFGLFSLLGCFLILFNNGYRTSIDRNHIGDYSFKTIIDTIKLKSETVVMEDDGGTWCIKKIFLNKDEWIVFETDEYSSNILRIKTNSSKYITKKGAIVGDSIGKLLNDNIDFSLEIEGGEIFFLLTDEDVYFDVNEHPLGCDELQNQISDLGEKRVLQKFYINTRITSFTISR